MFGGANLRERSALPLPLRGGGGCACEKEKVGEAHFEDGLVCMRETDVLGCYGGLICNRNWP